MKELSIEEKAKAWCKLDNNDLSNDDLKTLFPELKESEDEMIRKHLISLFEKFVTLGVANECETSEIKVDDILAWLEKQGKQNLDWSEEDEDNFIGIGNYISCSDSPEGFETWIDWLKSIKQRIGGQSYGSTR